MQLPAGRRLQTHSSLTVHALFQKPCFIPKILLGATALISYFPSGIQAKRKVRNVEEATQWNIMQFKAAMSHRFRHPTKLLNQTCYKDACVHQKHSIRCTLCRFMHLICTRSQFYQHGRAEDSLYKIRLYISVWLSFFNKELWRHLCVTGFSFFFNLWLLVAKYIFYLHKGTYEDINVFLELSFVNWIKKKKHILRLL